MKERQGIPMGLMLLVLLVVWAFSPQVSGAQTATKAGESGPAVTGQMPAAQAETSPQPGGSAAEIKVAANQPSFEEKLKELKARLEKNPNDPEPPFLLGNLYYDQGSRDDAEKYFREALKLDPKMTKALVNLGVVMNESGKSQEGLEQLEKALALRPNDAEVLSVKGQILYALKRYSEAVALYLKAIDADPKSTKGHYWLGVAFADAQIYKEAIVEWQKVVEIAPDSPDANTAREGITVLQQMLKAN